MAMPRCPKCNSPSFDATHFHPGGANHSILIVHCASCGYAIGTMAAEDVVKKVKELSDHVNRVDHNVRTLGERLGR